MFLMELIITFLILAALRAVTPVFPRPGICAPRTVYLCEVELPDVAEEFGARAVWHTMTKAQTGPGVILHIAAWGRSATQGQGGLGV